MNIATQPVELVIPDTGPLISLALGDALDLLLLFPERVRLIVTDFVEFEVTRSRDRYADGRRIAAFLKRHAGRIEIQATAFGQLMKQAFLNRERFETDGAVRDTLTALGMEPAPLPNNAGELSIISYVNELVIRPSGPPVLVLAEDDFFLHPMALNPGNAHILSTRAFLDTLETLGKIRHADTIWRRIQRARPNVNGARIDRPAAKIDTSWADTLSGAPGDGMPARRQRGKKAPTAGKPGR